MKAIAGTQYGSQGVVQAQGTAQTTQKSKAMAGSRMLYSRVIGALFLLGYLFYGGGFGLVASFTGAPDFLSTIFANQSIFIIGAFLMLVNTLLDAGKGVLLFPILEKHGKRTALAYLATMIIEVVMLTVGTLALLMLVPLAQQAADAGQASAGSTDWINGLGSLLVQSNAMAYNIGELTLAVGCIFLCTLLFRTRLVPRWLSVSGLIGYPLLMVGCIAEIFGVRIGTQLTIPGIFFEVVLPFWLMIKGFQPEAYAASESVTAEPVEITPIVSPTPVGF